VPCYEVNLIVVHIGTVLNKAQIILQLQLSFETVFLINHI
jgi:hypothetical protein